MTEPNQDPLDSARILHEALDQFKQLIDMAAGYRESAIAAGFSPEAAEAMAVQAHEVFIHKAVSG